MGYASYLIYTKLDVDPRAKTALSIYAAKVVLNAAWSPLFFTYKKLGWATMEIWTLWGAILLTAKHFYAIDSFAGKLFIPYIAWVSYASMLCTNIWWNNSNKSKKN